MDLVFTGVGHRKGVPDDIRKKAEMLTTWLCQRHVRLRTGDADGMDRIFREAAPKDMCDFFAPLGRFNPHRDAIIIGPSELYNCPYREAVDITANTHPTFHYLGDFERELHIRNVFEVLGPNLDHPADFLICWTKDGAETKTTRLTGGTGQAIRIANKYGIPVFNLQRPDFESRFSTFIKKLGEQHARSN